MADAQRFAFPDEAIFNSAEAELRFRADDLDHARRIAADPQINSPNAAMDGRARHLVEHDAAALAHMLDGEDRAIGEHARREARLVAYIEAPEIAIARCREAGSSVRCHAGPPGSRSLPDHALVSRIRSSHHSAASSERTSHSKDTRKLSSSSVLLNAKSL